jgi:trimethylamine--corrinoid protein Co-methyltransferase
MKTRDYDIERNVGFSVLTDKAKKLVHEAAIEILETIGMRVTGERVLAKFAQRGITPDSDGIIFITRELVSWALGTVPHEITLYGIDGEERMKLDSSNRVYFGTHADQLEMLDYRTNRARRYSLKDVELMCKLASNLENIDFVLTVGITDDVPPVVQSQVSFIETCMYMQKTINFSTNTIEALQEIIDIAAVVAGGKDKLIEKPFIFNYCEPIPPLTHPTESTEKLFVSAENMIPCVYMPYCMMGGTAPLDRPATLAQCFAEILAGLVISQLAREGAPFIIGAMPSIMDMRTTIGSYAAPEFHLMVAAASEMADYYNLPFYGTAACSDAKTVDPQSMSEISYQLMTTMLSKANLVHDVGIFDHCNSVSPAAVVLANEIINSYKSFNRGVVIENQESIDLELIRGVGHAKHHMLEENTLERFREVWYPDIFTRAMTNKDESDILEQVSEIIDGIIATNPGSTLPPGTLDYLNTAKQKYLDSAKE